MSPAVQLRMNSDEPCTAAKNKRHAVRYLSLLQTELKDQTVCSRSTGPADEWRSRSRLPDETRVSLPLHQDLAESTHL